jgi:hypothetical protein
MALQFTSTAGAVALAVAVALAMAVAVAVALAVAMAVAVAGVVCISHNVPSELQIAPVNGMAEAYRLQHCCICIISDFRLRMLQQNSVTTKE